MIYYYFNIHRALEIKDTLPEGARVVLYELGWAIQYYKSGPYYPEREKEGNNA